MDEKELAKLQKYIGKREKEQTTEQVIAHIQKINDKVPLSTDEWSKLLLPACSYPDTFLLRWLVEQGANLDAVIDEDLPRSIIWGQEKRLEYQKKRVEVLQEIVSLADKESLPHFLGEALKQACWYNNIYVVEYLVNAGGDLQYVDKNGKTPYEYAKIYAERFDDDTLYHYLREYIEKKDKGIKLFRKKCKLSDSEKFFTGKDLLGNTTYEGKTEK